MTPKKRVLFLCVGNTCRSQMAEAIVNAQLAARWEAFSAGSYPEGSVNPLALKALQEIGITHRGKPKSVDVYHQQAFDLVVILCDQDDDQCPVWLAKGMVVHQPYRDPALASGSENQKMVAYRAVRDLMLDKIPGLLK